MRRSNPRVLLDCDGPMADFMGATLGVYKDITGKAVDPNSLTKWYFTDQLFPEKEEGQLSDQAREFWRRLRAPGYCMSLKPIPGAVESVGRILEAGIDVHVVTSPMKDSPTWAFERETWLAGHFKLPRQRIHHSNAKHIYSGDLFLEDNPDNLLEWGDHNPTGATLLWDTPSNRNSSAFSRVKTWSEIEEILFSRKRRRA